MSIFPVQLETERLLLRPVAPADDLLIHDYWAGDIEVARYMSWRLHTSLEDTRSYITNCLERRRLHSEATYIALTKNEGSVVGSLAIRPRGHMVEVGYLVRKSHWGCGIATEMLRGMVGWLFEHSPAIRIWGYCNVQNKASARVMEKSGMSCEGTLRAWATQPNYSDLPCDAYVFSILRSEWKK